MNREQLQAKFPNASQAFLNANAEGERLCLQCGKSFWYEDANRQGKGEFCSQPCAAKFIGIKSIIQNRRKLPRTKLTKKICQGCGLEFESWASANRKFCSQKCSAKITIPKGLITKSRNGRLVTSNTFSNCKRGWREIGGKKIFARSSWESNYARYLQFLKERGEIVDWFHESKTFWFEKIRRGCRCYTPDFEVIKQCSPELLAYNKTEFHEVKGWMTSRSKTAINRMSIYHPTVILVVIDRQRYKALHRTVGRIIRGWEQTSA